MVVWLLHNGRKVKEAGRYFSASVNHDMAMFAHDIHQSNAQSSRERTVQINTIGTTLVSLLLLAWMREARGQRKEPARLLFVSSRDHLYNDINQLDKWSQSKDGILREICSKDNWQSGFFETQPNYNVSKLLLMYMIEGISELARGPDGE